MKPTVSDMMRYSLIDTVVLVEPATCFVNVL